MGIEGNKKWYFINWLTGGRPMTFVQSCFVDSVVHRAVNIYRDRLGRMWLAYSEWGSFRVRVNDE